MRIMTRTIWILDYCYFKMIIYLIFSSFSSQVKQLLLFLAYASHKIRVAFEASLYKSQSLYLLQFQYLRLSKLGFFVDFIFHSYSPWQFDFIASSITSAIIRIPSSSG